jgi:hypothetical protein
MVIKPAGEWLHNLEVALAWCLLRFRCAGYLFAATKTTIKYFTTSFEFQFSRLNMKYENFQFIKLIKIFKEIRFTMKFNKFLKSFLI